MAEQERTPLVGIIMGSKSDLPVMEGCTAELEKLGVSRAPTATRRKCTSGLRPRQTVACA